jgi:hypothetical protein
MRMKAMAVVAACAGLGVLAWLFTDLVLTMVVVGALLFCCPRDSLRDPDFSRLLRRPGKYGPPWPWS